MNIIEIKTEKIDTGLSLIIEDLACTEANVLVITDTLSTVNKLVNAKTTKAINKAFSNSIELNFIAEPLDDEIKFKKKDVERIYVVPGKNFILSNYDIYNLANTHDDVTWVFVKQLGV